MGRSLDGRVGGGGQEEEEEGSLSRRHEHGPWIQKEQLEVMLRVANYET